MLAVLLMGLNVIQNLHFSPAVAVIIACTHFAYLKRDGLAELALLAC